MNIFSSIFPLLLYEKFYVIWFWFKVRCVALIQENVLHTLNVCRRHIENFLRASEVKVFAKNSHKMIEYSETWKNFRDLNFKNPLEGHFIFNKKCFVSHKVMIQCALHFPDLGKRFTNSKFMHTMHSKISASFWSQSLR